MIILTQVDFHLSFHGIRASKSGPVHHVDHFLSFLSFIFHLFTLPPPSSPLFPLPSTATILSISCHHQNYLLWKSQFLAILTHNLVGYVDGSLKCPPQFITQNNVSSINPTYTLWFKQDQHLASWIMATLTEHLLVQLLIPSILLCMSFGLSWRGILHLPPSCRSFFFAASSKPSRKLPPPLMSIFIPFAISPIS